MKQFATTFTLIVFVSLVLAGCKVSSPTVHSVPNSQHDHTRDDADSILHTHETLPVLSNWCDDCNFGYVAGQRISSKVLFETLDAHGHDVNIDAMTCASCLTALPVGGYCESHRIGFVDSKAYFSRLTYSLAKGGEARNVSSLTCTTCRANAQEHGWCAACQIGMVGNVAFKNRNEYTNAVEQFSILKSAIDKTGDCEMCASAMILDSRCPLCKISYQDGQPIANP
ncbi:MAG: hypothetical protein IH984_13730 [Planctomycetes bacterium]|nr:hypothetical protein [Planctomycetota bacterium]